ncbi:histidine kinase [Agromyces badenianii]|uniref:Histidine kinase n=1 Tax=Agromyces badenianii TaxID=2080742 RepID=A0A2S0WUK5_9MICO|nr:ATP-binding protein [Agromyces badenianii]AWB95025.1 histidine kinase [Agromyces badenianii]PWC03102.1 histidine kinase [Agromyces badenianii]
MKRIHKERDRLLRRLARVSGLSGALGALACLLVPATTSGVELVIASLLTLAAGTFIALYTVRGAVFAALVAVACSITLISVLGAAPVISPSAVAAMAITASVTASSVAIPLIVRPNGPFIVLGLVAATLVAIGIIAITGHEMTTVAIGALMGWAANVAIGIWLDRAISAASERINEVGRAHEAERLASEFESQQRQDARVLHDTVLATLSLLAHSGVGVGASALRQQAGDDARLLKQLRLGAPLDRGSTAIFSPESDDESLGVTFESVRQRFARMGLDVNWHGAGRLALPRDTLDALIGALGECLENVRRHSGVTQADVTVSDDDRTVRAMVTDAGTGFEPVEVDGARLGYAESVVGRLSTVGGRARIFSSPGSGTTVMLEVPKP